MGRPFSFWDRVFDNKSRQRKSRRRHRNRHHGQGRKLSFESLEIRALLSADSLVVTLTNADFDENSTVDGADFVSWEGNFGTTTGAEHGEGDADFDGDVDGFDFLAWQRGFGSTSPDPFGILTIDDTQSGVDQIIVSVVDVAGTDFVAVNGLATTIAADLVEAIIVRGGDGDDLIDLSLVGQANFPNLIDDEIAIYGSEGNDAIFGSTLADEIFGGLGDDEINGLTGDDLLLGGAGDDVLNGGVGDDTLDGGPGADQINGDWGDDTFVAENGEQEGDEYSDNDQPNPPLQQPGGSFNTPPLIQPVGERTVKAGQTLTFTFQVTDPDLPGQTLLYEILGNQTLVNQQGVFSWTPDQSDVGLQNFTLQVTDNGAVPLHDLELFTVQVTSGALDPPARLTATPSGSLASVALSWNAVTDATGYALRRSLPTSSSWTNFFGLSGTSYTDTDINPGSRYEYEVRATNSVGDSEWSPAVEIATFLPTPSDLTVTILNDENDREGALDIQLDWSYSLSASDLSTVDFQIERAKQGNSWSVISTPSISTATDGSGFSRVRNNQAQGEVYFYRIVAINDLVEDVVSSYSNIVTVTTAPLNFSEKVGDWYVNFTGTGSLEPESSPALGWHNDVDTSVDVSAIGGDYRDGILFFPSDDPDDEDNGGTPVFQIENIGAANRPGDDLVFFNLQWSVDTYVVTAPGAPTSTQSSTTLSNWTFAEAFTGYSGVYSPAESFASGGAVVGAPIEITDINSELNSVGTLEFVGSFSSDPLGLGSIKNEFGYRIDLAVAGVLESQEENTNNIFLGVNGNLDEGNVDADGNPLPDNDPDSSITLGDPQLLPVDVHFMSNIDVPGTWRLEFDDDNIRVWNGTTEIQHNEEMPITISGTSQTISLLVEGIDGAHTNLKAVFQPDETGSNAQSTSDTILLDVEEADLDIDIPGGGTVADDKELAPGGYLVLNNDDDDEDGILDFEDDDVQNDDDLLELRLKNISGNDLYQLEFDVSKIRLWADDDKSEELLPGPADFSTTSSRTFYVEGIAASSSLGDVEITATASSAGNSADTIRLTVVTTNLSILGEDGTELTEKEEGDEGAFVQLNNDDDDRDGILDRVDSNGVAGDNDLVPLTLRPIENSLFTSADGNYELVFDVSKTRIWVTLQPSEVDLG